MHLVFRRIEEHAEYLKNKGEKGKKIPIGYKFDWKNNLIAAKKQNFQKTANSGAGLNKTSSSNRDP